MKLKLVAAVVVAVVVASSVVYYRAGAASTQPRFHTAPVTRGAVVETVGATGTVEPVDTVEVGSQVTGTIKTLAVDFNDMVKRGQVIATLDPASLEAQVQQAEASVRRLEADEERARVQVKDAEQKQARAEALAHEQLLPASDLDAARIATEVSRAALKSVQAQLVQAQASLAQSRVNLGHTIITAPVDGIVLSRDVEVGQTVTANLETPTLFVIARDLGTMQVNASVDEADIGRVKVGQPVPFHVDAYGDDEFTGTVSQVRLQPTVEQNVVSYTTEIQVPNTALKLKPGMTATVSIEVAREDDALRVPDAALRFNPSAGGPTSANARPVVWRLVDGALERVPVEIGVSDGISSAIVSDRLAEGAQVVVGQPSAVESAAGGASSGSPLLPSFPRRRSRGRS